MPQAMETQKIYDGLKETFPEEQAHSLSLMLAQAVERTVDRLSADTNSKDLDHKIAQIRKDIKELDYKIAQLRKDGEEFAAETKREIEKLRSETKKEIEKFKSEVKQDIEQLKSEVKQDIEQLKSETKQDIENLRSEIKRDIKELAAETKKDIKELDHRIVRLEVRIEQIKTDILKWVGGLLLAQTGVIAALVKLL